MTDRDKQFIEQFIEQSLAMAMGVVMATVPESGKRDVLLSQLESSIGKIRKQPTTPEPEKTTAY